MMQNSAPFKSVLKCVKKQSHESVYSMCYLDVIFLNLKHTTSAHLRALFSQV